MNNARRIPLTVGLFLVTLGAPYCSRSNQQKPKSECPKTSIDHTIQAIEHEPGQEADGYNHETDASNRVTLEDGSKWIIGDPDSKWEVGDQVRLITTSGCETALQSVNRLDEVNRPDTVEAEAVKPVSNEQKRWPAWWVVVLALTVMGIPIVWGWLISRHKRRRVARLSLDGMMKDEQDEAKPVQNELEELLAATRAAAKAKRKPKLTRLPRDWSWRGLIEGAGQGEGLLGCALYLAILSAVASVLWLLRLVGMEWMALAGATWAIARAVGRDNGRPRWVLGYLLAVAVALFLYAYAAGEDQNLFDLVVHPADFHHGVEVGLAALLAMWAGIAAVHFCHDPEWVRDKRRRGEEAEGTEVINSGGRWIGPGGEMTVFEGRLVPMFLPATQERIGPSLSKEVLTMIDEGYERPRAPKSDSGA
jgi:hypothetical protein